MNSAKTTLSKYLPPQSMPLVMALLRSEPVMLKIVSPRKTKFGDYRFPHKRDPRHRISLNSNLNPFAFLITLIHEMAHLKAFKDYGHKIKAHGPEWQQVFWHLCQPFFQATIFPSDLARELEASLQKGSASSCTDVNLYRALKKYDADAEQKLHLEELPEGSTFSIDHQKLFKKGPRSRKRYRCLNLKNGREYMVHPLAEVHPIESDKNTKSA